MFTLSNSGASPEDLVATITWNGVSGQYKLPIHLEAGASQVVDMVRLIAANRPDSDGNTVPADVHEGSAMFASTAGPHETLSLVVSGGEYNVETAACCPVCICCDGVVCYDVSPSSANLPDGDMCQLYATVYWEDGSHPDVTGNGNTAWVSGNTSVATVDGGGLVTGVAPGTATIDGYFDGIEPGQVCNYCLQCITQQYLGSCNMSVEVLGSFAVSISSPAATGETGSMIAGQSAQVTVTAKDQFSETFAGYTGTVLFSSSDTLATLPSNYTYTSSDGGAHTFSVALKTVSGTSAARDLTVKDQATGISATDSVSLWFQVSADVEFWKNCGFAGCSYNSNGCAVPNGSYHCTVASGCGPGCTSSNKNQPQGYANTTAFIALPYGGLCPTGVDVRASVAGTWSATTSTSVGDIGPGSSTDNYWNTGSIPSMGACLSDKLATGLGVSNGCNPGPYGGATILWRFQ